MRRSSKLAERTRLETWVFIVKWQSDETPKFLTKSDKGTNVQLTVIKPGKKKKKKKGERSELSTRGYDHCFSPVLI